MDDEWKELLVRESNHLTLAVLGGGVGAICIMLLVGHNACKGSFFWKFWPIFVTGAILNVVFIGVGSDHLLGTLGSRAVQSMVWSSSSNPSIDGDY